MLDPDATRGSATHVPPPAAALLGQATGFDDAFTAFALVAFAAFALAMIGTLQRRIVVRFPSPPGTAGHDG